MTKPCTNPIVLYDGICGLCNHFVQFILKRDRSNRFRFAALQSEFAGKVLSRHGLDAADLNTVYLVRGYALPEESVLSWSSATIGVLAELGGIWSLVSGFLGLLPRPLRDYGYRVVARNRYGIFGKYDACPLPDPKDSRKFLDHS